MSDTNTPNLAVERNGVTLTLTEQVFGKKSPNAGKKFFAPEIKQSNWDTSSVWVGVDTICGLTNRALRKTFADIHLDENNYNEDGTVNWDRMAADWADFTAGVQKLSDLEDEIDELQSQQQALAMDEAFVPDDNGNLVGKAAEIAEQMKQIAIKIKPLRAQVKAIEAKYAARAAKRKAKEATSPTKTA